MARKTTDDSFIPGSLKRYSIGLLLAGMALIAGSCVPLAQIVVAGADSTRFEPLTLSPDGGTATLTLDEAATLVPLVLIEVPAAPAGYTSDMLLAYALSITSETGRSLMREEGEAASGAAAGVSGAGGSAALELRFPPLAFPAGRSVVRFQAGPADLIENAELRLFASGPGLIPGLITALSIAILGWLSASIGALQWIRAEAARPRNGAGVPDRGAERAWTTGCHLSALAGYVLPFGHLVGPALIWMAKRRTLPAVDQAGRDVLNFQLSATLYVLVGLFLSFFLIGLVVLFVVIVFHFTMVLVAALRAQRGAVVNYPLTMRFI